MLDLGNFQKIGEKFYTDMGMEWDNGGNLIQTLGVLEIPHVTWASIKHVLRQAAFLIRGY